jgi:hypothetical protein
VIDGPWLVRACVGSVPVIIGRKIETQYFSGEGFLEASNDVYASSAAKAILKVVVGAAKSLTIEIGREELGFKLLSLEEK